MNAGSQTFSVARREFTERAKSRVFIITLVLLSALIIVGFVALSFISGGEGEPMPLGVAGDSPEGIVQDIETAAAFLDESVEVTEFESVDAAEAAINNEEVDAVLVDGNTIVALNDPSFAAESVLTAAANGAARRTTAEELGLSPEDVASLVAPIEIGFVELDPPEPGEGDPEEDAEAAARMIASFFAAIVLLTTIMMFGQYVAMGIVEEKQNRVVEVVLAKIRTTSLLIGKVFGIGALGLLQVTALGAAAVIGLVVVPLDNIDVPDLTSIGIAAVFWLIFWFVLGYLVYSFLYATLGATISRQEDLQSVAFIPALAIMPGYFIVTIGLSSGGESSLVKWASLLPIWSPIVMPFRINLGVAAVWEIAVAIALALLTIGVLVFIGARVYRGAALRTGARVSLREAWSSGD